MAGVDYRKLARAGGASVLEVSALVETTSDTVLLLEMTYDFRQWHRSWSSQKIW